MSDTAVAKPSTRTTATTIEQLRKQYIMDNDGTSSKASGTVFEGGGPANKKPRLQKSAKAPSTEPDGDPNSLLIIGDALSHTVAYLPVTELCNAEMTCRSLRQLAGPILDEWIDKMNRDCLGKVPREGKGSRTNLLRYLAAVELAERVRDGLDDHLVRRTPPHPPKCKGCTSFPEPMDRRTFFIDEDGLSSDPNPDYEFFFYFVEEGAAKPKFQGCLPMHQEGGTRDYFFSFGDVRESKWEALKEFRHGATSSRADSLEKFEALASSNLSIIVIAIVTAIQKHDDTVSFVGAGSDFSDFTAEDGGIEVYTSNSIFLQDFVHDRVDVDHTFHIFINFDWEKHFKRDLSLQFDLDAFASRNYGTI